MGTNDKDSLLNTVSTLSIIAVLILGFFIGPVLCGGGVLTTGEGWMLFLAVVVLVALINVALRKLVSSSVRLSVRTKDILVAAIVFFILLAGVVQNMTKRQRPFTKNVSSSSYIPILSCGEGYIRLVFPGKTEYIISPSDCWTPWLLKDRRATTWHIYEDNPIEIQISRADGSTETSQDTPLKYRDYALDASKVTGFRFHNTSNVSVRILFTQN